MPSFMKIDESMKQLRGHYVRIWPTPMYVCVKWEVRNEVRIAKLKNVTAFGGDNQLRKKGQSLE